MKKLYVFVMLGAALTAGAQNKIDFAGRLAIDGVRLLEQQGGATREGNSVMSVSAAVEQKFNVIVEFVSDDIEFGDINVEIISSIGNMAVVNATASQMESIAAMPEVKQVSLGFENNSLMYKARPAGKVDAIQTGSDGLGGVQYTGKGVVTGLYDTGLDVNHVNFIAEDGSPRTKALWTYSSSGKVNSYLTADQISKYTTEDNTESHGTHVLGIMSGSYAGPATYAVIASNGKSAQLVKQTDENSSIPFYGVATEADLAVSCGPLYDGNIVSGVQKIVEYAKSQGQPCVVNLSIGSNLGPHDGTDAVAKYLAELGKDAIICIAAGNEGADNISISTVGETIKTFIVPSSSGKSATVQFWGSDDQPFTVKFIGYNRSTGKEAFSYTLDQNLAGKSVGQKDMAGFANAFTGTATLSSNVNTANNRYNVSASVNVNGTSSMIIAGFVIEPKENQSVDGFVNGWTFSSESMPGFTDGNANNSINDMACGENVVVVGSFTTAATWAALMSSEKVSLLSYSSRPAVGTISSFSSYGKTFAGKQLPDVCAPGEGIISSYSQYYVDKVGSDAVSGYIAGEYEAPKGFFSRNSPWGLMQGTSMACPFVAGVVAAWLQADPTLTIADVQNVIAKSSTKDFFTSSKANRWGAGKIDALSGLKEVIASAGINDVTADMSDVIVTSADGRTFEIYAAGAKKLHAELFSLSGLLAAATTADGDEAVLDAASVTPGVYVLKVNTGKTSKAQKIVIR